MVNIFFTIFAPLFALKSETGGGGMTYYIEKKASFRLSDEVNLDNLLMITRISGTKLAY